MKSKAQPLCRHDWEDLYVFRVQGGARCLQQRCRKCKASRYIEMKEEETQNLQNSSPTEMTHE